MPQRRECTAPRPRRGPRGGEALAGVRRRARVRVQGAGRRDERADGPEASRCAARAATSAATAGRTAATATAPGRSRPPWATGARDTQAQARHLLPRGHARAMVARRHLGGLHRAGRCTCAACPPARSSAWRPSWAYPRCRARRSRALLRPRRRGGGVPPPRPFGHAVLLPVARRHLHELQGSARRSSRRAS